jgi:homoserine kinase
VYVRQQPDSQIVKIKTPAKLKCIIILPDIRIRTEDARGILHTQVGLAQMVEQTSNLTGFLLGCLNDDFGLIQNSMRDVVIEPQRAKLIPGFYSLQKSALKAGALGFSISGSGPAMFALVDSAAVAKRVYDSLLLTAREVDLPLAGSWITKISNRGAHLMGQL